MDNFYAFSSNNEFNSLNLFGYISRKYMQLVRGNVLPHGHYQEVADWGHFGALRPWVLHHDYNLRRP